MLLLRREKGEVNVVVNPVASSYTLYNKVFFLNAGCILEVWQPGAKIAGQPTTDVNCRLHHLLI
jgi:hypothetical protein